MMRDQGEEMRLMKDVQDLGWGSNQGKPHGKKLVALQSIHWLLPAH